MRKTATWGGSRGSKGVGWLHGGEAKALAGSPWLGRGRSYGNDPEGIAEELGSGTAARGLPGQAAASYYFVRCERVRDGARGG